MTADTTPTEGLPDPSAVPRPWLGAYPPGVPANYDIPPVPMVRLLDDAAHDFPDLVASDHRGYRVTYRGLLDKVDRFAAALAALGVGPGDRVAILLPNVAQHVIALFALWRRAAAAVELDLDLPGDVIGRRLDETGCRAVICWDPLYDRLAALKGRLGTVAHVIGTGAADYVSTARSLLHPVLGHREGTAVRIPAGEGVLRLRDLIGRSAPTVAQEALAPATTPALLTYPPGSRARAGAVVASHANLVASAFQVRLWIPDVKAGQESILCAVPFSRAFGVITGIGVGVLSAATLVLEPRGESTAAARVIGAQRPTVLCASPRLFAALATDDATDLTSLRVCLSVGGVLRQATVAAVERRTGARVRHGYGLDEAGAMTHGNPVYGRTKPGTIGLPLPNTTAILVDPRDASRSAAPGEPGELAVAGPQVAHGYWHRPGATAATFRGGWLLTGDLAAVDEDGYFTLLGTKPDP